MCSEGMHWLGGGHFRAHQDGVRIVDEALGKDPVAPPGLPGDLVEAHALTLLIGDVENPVNRAAVFAYQKLDRAVLVELPYLSEEISFTLDVCGFAPGRRIEIFRHGHVVRVKLVQCILGAPGLDVVNELLNSFLRGHICDSAPPCAHLLYAATAAFSSLAA